VYLKYFKNKELTTLYNVSDKTVRNWIAASQEGKLGLKLVEENDRTYIADSIANNQLMEQTVAKGKKYRNNRNHKTLSPSQEFYKLFSFSQIVDIANQLDNHHELPWQYMYFGDAASYWDKYLHELQKAGRSNLLTNTIEALDLSAEYIDALVKPYRYVNVINVCVGNNLGIRKTLARLQRQSKLKRFIAIDISNDILEVSERNINHWFNGSIQMEKYQLDVRHQAFGDIIAKDTYGEDASATINLIFFVAGPIVNFKNPQQVLRNINDSMGKNDLLFTSLKRNTPQTRQFFDFNIKSDQSLLGGHHKILLDQIGVDDSLYELEQVVDEEAKYRRILIRLKSSLSIVFKTGDFQKTVSIEKGETILLWRSKQYYDQDIIDIFREADFSPIHVSQSLDRQLNLLISKINTD
jgi:uncharacterized SAM-dependent methyltransferase